MWGKGQKVNLLANVLFLEKQPNWQDEPNLTQIHQSLERQKLVF
jgi:hypothetical protein